MFVNVNSSSAVCAEALRGAMAALCIFDWASWEAVLDHDPKGFALALCTALCTESPAPVAVAEVGVQAVVATCDAGSTMGSGIICATCGVHRDFFGSWHTLGQ